MLVRKGVHMILSMYDILVSLLMTQIYQYSTNCFIRVC